MEVSEYLVGSPAFKAGGTGDPRTAGSIPVHLRCYSPQGSIRPFGPRLALRLAGGRDRSDRLRSFELAVFAAGSIRPFGPRLALRLPTKDLCHIWHPTGAKRGTNLGAGGDL